jgi:hypothetical protein
LTCRTLHFSRVAICSALSAEPVLIEPTPAASDGRHKRDTQEQGI